MNKLLTAMFAAALLLGSVATAQNSQELPPAPTPVQPRFPGAPVQPPSTQPPPAALTANAPGGAVQQQTPESKGAPKAGEAAPLFAPMNIQPAPQQAEKPKEAAETGEFRIGVQVDLVDLIFTATDKHGRFIKDLKKDDVRLLDEGKPPLRIEAFESETGLPLRVGLLIDASNSIRDRFRFEQDSAVEFLHQVVRPKTDRAFVIGFDSLADLTQDYTDDTEALARGVRILRPGGGTALHDAVFQACEKLAKAPTQGAVRRAIILLSDGDDNQSRRTREEAIEAALRAEVIIYVISTNITDSDKKGDKILMRYAEATGGRVFFPLRLEEVSNAFAEIQDELRSQYVIAYKPENFVSDGRFRAISIDAPKRANVKLRARKGYYAPRSAQ
ncbi:MAG: VWA domain-containing protein [Candidatus Korobacteraceae bacterium]|jgi:VWFA-related protein